MRKILFKLIFFYKDILRKKFLLYKIIKNIIIEYIFLKNIFKKKNYLNLILKIVLL